ncbi:MAG: HAMP domain-containing histidine kinase [Crocinitomicaceae bacterium]|nr:HAMP domain-containing histidine kinase [Crocinitomicaceae bacterium]
MNLYHKKQRWKIALLGIAIILVGASLWFSFSIVEKVQQREVDRIEQWADAVKRKSELVKLTNNAFEELSQSIEQLKERDFQKMEMWALAINEISKPLNDYSFVIEILERTNSIPVIITDMEENVVSSYNLSNLDTLILRKINADFPEATKKFKDSTLRSMRTDSLDAYVKFWQIQHAPLEIDLYYGEKQKVFYFDSIYYKTQKLEALEFSRDSLINAFSDELVTNEYLVPVMFIDKETRDVISTNRPDFDSTNANQIIEALIITGDSIEVELGSGHIGVIYYEHSEEVTQMKFFPIVQFFIIGLFVLIAYIAFSTFRKAEQDQVWAGMAKETAHQLGTPISSLMAWNQLLESKGVDESITSEINKDIDRLNTVTNRFSKIGSEAVLEEGNIVNTVRSVVDYLRLRISSKIDLFFECEQENIQLRYNSSLIEWAIENIAKNAVDSMEGVGSIMISVQQIEDEVIIDITDTGKGIPANKIKSVFRPGFTTKKRGWGLGLSLVKRIIEEFHKGKVFVQKSEIDVGTTFRIQLPV